MRTRHVEPASLMPRQISRSIWNARDRQPEDLAEVGFLADCTPDQRDRIASLSTTLNVLAGRRLCRAGDSNRQFLVIVKGVATVTVDGADVATLGPGCGFGTVAVLTPDGWRGGSVTAATPMTLLVLNRGEFDTLAKDLPVVTRRVQDETASRLSQARADSTSYLGRKGTRRRRSTTRTRR
jgi:CRP-like cAMP-binding protein